MFKVIIAGFAVFIFSTAAMAEKPEWAGNGKPTAEQKEVGKSAKQAKQEMDEDRREGEKSKEHMDKNAYKHKEDSDRPKGLDKQYEKKSSQEQKELGKGSEKGQEASSNKKKWWKFWE